MVRRAEEYNAASELEYALYMFFWSLVRYNQGLQIVLVGCQLIKHCIGSLTFSQTSPPRL